MQLLQRTHLALSTASAPSPEIAAAGQVRTQSLHLTHLAGSIFTSTSAGHASERMYTDERLEQVRRWLEETVHG